MILALSERSVGATEKAWIKMFEGVENGTLADIQSKTGISRQRLKHTQLRWLGVGKCKVSESTENWAYMHLFAEKIKKNTFLVVILPQFARSNVIFSKRDYSTLLFSVEYEGIFTTKHDDVQHTHQDGALSMPVFYTKFPEQQTGHCDDVNKRHLRYRLAMC